MSAPILAITGLTVCFGGLTAVDDLSFQVQPGEIHALIGPNGAGKSTTFNCISRYYDPTSTDFRQPALQQDGRTFRVKLTYRF